MAERPVVAKLGVIAVLALVLAVILLRQVGVLAFGAGTGGDSVAAPPDGQMSPSTPPGTSAIVPASPAARMQWKRPEPVGPLGRDPMRLDLSKQPAPAPKVDTSTRPAGYEFTVTGIVFSTEQPSSVIIEGRILHEGDSLHGVTVARITQDSVEFSMGDKKWTVKAGEQTTSPQP
jgi:hypothetical protein